MERTLLLQRGSSSLALWFDCSESCCRVTRALRNYILYGSSYKSSKCARGGKEKNKISRTNQPNCSQMYGNWAIPANVLGRRFLEIHFATVTSSSDITYNTHQQVPPPLWLSSKELVYAAAEYSCWRSPFWVYTLIAGYIPFQGWSGFDKTTTSIAATFFLLTSTHVNTSEIDFQNHLVVHGLFISILIF